MIFLVRSTPRHRESNGFNYACAECARHTHAPLKFDEHPRYYPRSPWARECVDYTERFACLLIIINAFNKWLKFEVMSRYKRSTRVLDKQLHTEPTVSNLQRLYVFNKKLESDAINSVHPTVCQAELCLCTNSERRLKANVDCGGVLAM